MDLKTAQEAVNDWIEENGKDFYACSDAIWSFAEIGLEEHESSKLLIRKLEEMGFTVQKDAAGMPSAFVASWGNGGPVIGINCEYDALTGLSQQVSAKKSPVVEGAPGQGCGHNILGVGSLIAAAAVRYWLEKNCVRGTVKIFGAPAEEICVGKPYMAKEGLFNGVDAIIDWHPFVQNGANYDTCNAYFNLKFHFNGRTAHGNAPWDGRSALDAAILTGHAIELLREHIPPGSPTAANTMNYSFSDVGPEYPNVVPDRSTLWVIGRITTSEEMEGIIRRIHKCAEGAALATGTTWSAEFITASHEKIPNRTISEVLYRNLVREGPPKFDAEEQETAKTMQRDMGVEETGLLETIAPFEGGASGVSDNSEYSWFAPFGMCWIVTGPPDIGWHNWQITATSGGSIGKKAMIKAAKVLAASAVELISDPAIVEEAKKELSTRLQGKAYKPLIPDGTTPPIRLNRETMEKYRALMEEHYIL